MKHNGIQVVIILLIQFMLVSTAIAEDKISLDIKVTGAEANTGQLLLAVFDSVEYFLKSPIINQIQAVDAAGMATFSLQQLNSGVYAISVVYDKDSNGELNTGLMGIPTELVGFSNNARGLFGPPSFNKAKVKLLESGILEIKLKKAKS